MQRISRIILGFAVVAAAALLTQTTLAHGNDRGTATATVAGAQVTIDYGRPALKGRDPLGLIKPGQVWRLGSDASTTLESDRDLDVGGNKVPKGKHILLARFDGPGKWSLVVSSKPWNQYEAGAKIAETPMTFAPARDSVETVTIKLSDRNGTGVISVEWGKLRLTAEFKPAP
ncbi:MAG: DUF2911 domain-containing protein [Terriglobia bacterium]|jgi:hypothetical protein